ncbi:hypothetical protein G7K_3800-t2 [Saitoella complicata NRRL Y-17804]|uniref:Amino acid permease/ SLC12A domain-containing protein n=1 Tax=Saitoella complicata (strain BCRC 22490 / CBS 7301 / JCM 7358 / NBRC 10748 / NRRL Y-17804) TaxID=698492 RepID=A0A0E9NIF6_SAICN|nr:hypothetical protein G7K_3800-t2 [Saitoella complicata NRRL Y-17804]
MTMRTSVILPSNLLPCRLCRPFHRLSTICRKRAHRHVEGQWATHIYTEFWPDVKLMSILDRIVKKAGSLDKGWTSLLVSELGNQLALHISLSRPLTLWTDEREDFTRALSRVLADIEPFEMTLDNISTFVNDERTRTFLVLEVNEGISEFGGVLRALEAVMKQFKQPALYTVDTARFHVSIAWRLGGEEMKVKQLLQFVEEFGEELQALWKDTSKTIRVKEVKAKIGNQIWVKKLGELNLPHLRRTRSSSIAAADIILKFNGSPDRNILAFGMYNLASLKLRLRYRLQLLFHGRALRPQLRALPTVPHHPLAMSFKYARLPPDPGESSSLAKMGNPEQAQAMDQGGLDKNGEYELQSSKSPGSTESNTSPTGGHDVKRKLLSRHLMMISIGGIIGPGLLVGTGTALATGGPSGIFIAYCLIGAVLYLTMQSLGELATVFPETGSFVTWAGRFGDDAMGFALGWNYWYMWVTILANEYVAATVVLSFWTNDTPPTWAWILILWVFFLAFSFLSVDAYGETEFWLASLKVVFILLFFIVGVVINVGGIGDTGYIGFRYWKDPGAFADGFSGVVSVFAMAATYYAGTEMVGLTAGESKDPRKNIPRAIRQVFFRILFIYVGFVFFTGILVPYNDENLLSPKSKTGASPITIAFIRAGWAAGAHLVNAVLVITIISAVNSSLYAASRVVCMMARDGKAPRILSKINKRGVPIPALIFSNLFGLISLMKQSAGAGKAYSYLINMSGVSAFIAWAIISLCHIRFRRAIISQNKDIKLHFTARWYPYGAYIGFIANVVLVFLQGYPTLAAKPFVAADFVVAYVVLPAFLVLFLGWKWWHKTKWVNLEEADLDAGRKIYEDNIEVMDEVGDRETNLPKGRFRQVWNVIVG